MEGLGSSTRQNRHAAQETTVRRKCQRDHVGVAGARERGATHPRGSDGLRPTFRLLTAAQVECVQSKLKRMLLNVCARFPLVFICSNIRGAFTSFTLTVGGPLITIKKILHEQFWDVCRKAVKRARVTAYQ